MIAASGKAPDMIRKIATTSAIAGGAALLATCAASLFDASPTVPEELRAPAGQVLSLTARATGVQVYDCNSNKTDPTRFEWIFKAPDAVLFDSVGRKIGKHYGGPTWESNDGSKVLGEVTARDDGPDADAIPWLLLKAKSTSGSGVLGQTQSIQRVRTAGGKAPAQGCTREQAGKEARMPYKATYYFYASRP
jgi:hypothetical protein